MSRRTRRDAAQALEAGVMSPECRRIVVRHAARENLDFPTALECLVIEGFKATANDDYPVEKSVNKLW